MILSRLTYTLCVQRPPLLSPCIFLYENIVSKGEIACEQQSLLLKHCFLVDYCIKHQVTCIKYIQQRFNPFLHINYFNTLNKQALGKHCGKKVKLLKMSNFTFFHDVFYAICTLKFLISYISFVVCSFFEFGMVPKWCIREWVKTEVCRKHIED